MELKDILDNEKIIIAAITAVSAFVGSFISTFLTYRIKNKEVKFSIQKDKREVFNTNINPKFELLLQYLQNCNKLIYEKTFTKPVVDIYKAIDFNLIKSACSELELKYGQDWSFYFILLNEKIKESFESANIDTKYIDLISSMEDALIYFQSHQKNNADAGNIRILLWRFKAKKQFNLQEKHRLLLNSDNLKKTF